MSKLQLLRVFLSDRLTAAAVEIFGAVEKTVAEYQEENEQLRRLLRITPDITLCRIESLQVSLAVPEDEAPSDQQHYEQEWSPSLRQGSRSPHRLKGKKRNSGPVKRKSNFKGWMLI
ncbi:hypothetical protein DPEC_G00098130 [Dallia pectoralis]|uniref:Uncharacterized protein n=1 Tax=Dallia pectoralis TaxID=75939 RepID=A0ACC2GVX4_DALPE|nr:hypothetical protein DPEC_G00098130 [Dallia pectoralis]